MILHLCSALVRHLAAVSRTRRMQTYWRETSKVQWRGWSIWHSQKGWKSCLLWITEGSGGCEHVCDQGDHTNTNTWRDGVKSQTLLTDVYWKGKRQIETWDIQLKENKKLLFIVSVVKHGNPLSRRLWGSSSLAIYKAWPDTTLSNLLLLTFHVQRYGNTRK